MRRWHREWNERLEAMPAWRFYLGCVFAIASMACSIAILLLPR